MVAAVVESVRVEDWPLVMLVGLKPTLTPAGAPVPVSATVCGLPLVTVLLMVLVPFCPAMTLSVVGLAVRAKSFGGAVTVSVTVVVWVALAPVPVMVIG